MPQIRSVLFSAQARCSANDESQMNHSKPSLILVILHQAAQENADSVATSEACPTFPHPLFRHCHDPTDDLLLRAQLLRSRNSSRTGARGRRLQTRPCRFFDIGTALGILSADQSQGSRTRAGNAAGSPHRDTRPDSVHRAIVSCFRACPAGRSVRPCTVQRIQ